MSSSSSTTTKTTSRINVISIITQWPPVIVMSLLLLLLPSQTLSLLILPSTPPHHSKITTTTKRGMKMMSSSFSFLEHRHTTTTTTTHERTIMTRAITSHHYSRSNDEDDDYNSHNDTSLTATTHASTTTTTVVGSTTTTNNNNILFPLPNCNADQLGPTSLAYIGDAVFELFARSRYVWPDRKTTELQETVVSIVRAETQSRLLNELQSSSTTTEQHQLAPFVLTPREIAILRRGRNAGGGGKRGKNRGPKRLRDQSSVDVYQDATALEALVGYLYITNVERCYSLFDWLRIRLDDWGL